MAYEEWFLGTLVTASMHPSGVVKLTLHHNSAAVLLTHNHPSGLFEPSIADIKITKLLQSVLARVDIRTLDHLLVGMEGGGR